MFFYLIAIIFLSRIFPLMFDKSLSIPGLFLMMFIQLFLLLFLSMNSWLFILLVILFVIDILNYWLEKKFIKYDLIRSILFASLWITAVIFSSGYAELTFNREMLSRIQSIIVIINPFTGFKLTSYNLIIIISGLLFLLNEANFLIRLLFELSGKIPVSKGTSELDRKELNAGRIIRMLERIFIFFFIIIGQYTAVGFVIAAKGIIRYQELEDRSFAEYVLIGTLFSSLLAMVTGFITAHLIL